MEDNSFSPHLLPVSVIAGYLGAGKTTLLNHILRHPQGKRLAVLVNDFGAINIDAALIESADDETMTLTNGCICCSIGGAFYDAIDAILKRNPLPDALIIEASGIAEPNRIANIARAEPDLQHDISLVLVDAVNFAAQFQDMLLRDSLERQIQQAELLVVTKSDIAQTTQKQKTYDILRTLAPQTSVIEAIQGEIDVSLISQTILSTAETITEHISNVSTSSHHHENIYQRWHYRGAGTADRVQLEKALENLPNGILRLKGFIPADEGVILVQHVAGRTDWQRLNKAEQNEAQLVAIGLRERMHLSALDKWCHKFILSDI